MDFTDDVADIIDPESEIFQSTNIGNNPGSSKPNERNEGTLKRKFMDVNGENTPKKIPRIDDNALTQLNSIENDLDVTWYSFADGEVNPMGSSCIDSANEIRSDLFQENINEEVNFSIINDKSVTSKGVQDENGAAVLSRTEQKEHLANDDILEEINTDDNQTQNIFRTSCISSINKNADENDVFYEITMADDINTLPKFSSTSTNNVSISINDVEKNCSLLRTEVNMDCPSLGENEECCANRDHQMLKNTREITDICSGFALFEASSTTTRSINDESPTKWYECEPITDTEFEKLNIDQKFLDYMSMNVESLAGKNEIPNQDKMIEIEEQASNSSACDTISMPLGDCSADQFPSDFHMGTLAHQESQNNDFLPDFGDIGDCDSHIITPEMKLQNTPQQIIEASKEESVILKNKQQSNDKHLDAVYKMDYIEPVAGENQIYNKNKVTKNEEQISNSSRCETMLMSSNDFSSAEIHSNTEALAQQELKNNFIPEQKSTETTELQNTPDQIVEANEEFSLISKNKESKDKLPNVTKKKRTIQKEEALEQERGIILDLMKEYIENTKLEEFSSSDIVDFIIMRMPNVTYFKVLHAVRIFIVNNLKSGVLKKSGQKYTLGYRASDASVANISEKM